MGLETVDGGLDLLSMGIPFAAGVGVVVKHPARTRIRTRTSRAGELSCSLIELRPETGRTHQLRVPCARRGFPVLGDRSYGDFTLNRRIFQKRQWRRLFLHALSIDVEFTWNGSPERFRAEAQPPREFREILNSGLDCA